MDEELDFERQRGWEEYWGIAKRRRWWIVLPGVLAWAIALAASWLVPPKYKSETVILVEQPEVPAQYVTPNVSVDVQTQLQSLSEQILSRTRLLRITQDLHLYSTSRLDTDKLIEKMRSDIVIDLIETYGHRAVSGFKISYSASTPQVAQAVAGRLASLFINENLRSQQELSQGTTEFLEAELQTARRDLESQEAQLKEFRTRYLGQLPEQLQGNMQILSGLQGQLDSANQAVNHAEQQKLYLSSLLERYQSPRNVPDGSGKTKSSVEQRLNELKSQLAERRLRYTPKHPDLIRLQEEIADAERLKQTMDAQPKRPSASEDTTANVADPTALQIGGQLRATELEIATRNKQIKELQGQIQAYQARLNLAPMREQQLAGLTRNYNQSRTNYESLLAKKMQSQMAANLEKRQQGEQFRVLDPPSFPRMPYFPKPLYFALGGLAAGLFLGAVLAAAKELLEAPVQCEQDIVEMGYAVFGRVPPLPTANDLRRAARRRWLEFAAAAVLAAVVPAITAVTYLKR